MSETKAEGGARGGAPSLAGRIKEYEAKPDRFGPDATSRPMCRTMRS